MGGGSLERDGATGARPGEASRATRTSVAEASAPDAALPGLQELLTGAVQRLAHATGAERVAAWARGADGTPFVVASASGSESSPPRAAEAAAIDAIFQCEGAIDLGLAGLAGLAPVLSKLASEHGFTAAAPLLSQPGEPLAVLLLGGSEDSVGRVRPRTLAELDAAVRRLKSPATTAAAIQRLSQLDEEVQRLDRLAVLGELLGEAVHELRNPLVSFKTFVELSADRATDPEFQTDFRNLVAEELRRMERLLDGILQQARPVASPPCSPDSGATGVANALESLGQLLEQRAQQRQVTLEVRAVDELPNVSVARDSLRQVLLNLTLNALDATPAGGTVSLSAAANAERVEICIDDEGAGVPADQRDRIFQPFVSSRTDRPGGLGLAISRKLVNEAGGSILVSDAPTGGARFCVSLPAAPESEPR